MKITKPWKVSGLMCCKYRSQNQEVETLCGESLRIRAFVAILLPLRRKGAKLILTYTPY